MYKSFEKKKLLPNQNFENTEHEQLLNNSFKVVTETEDWTPGNVCISNYGFGGTNAFAVISPVEKLKICLLYTSDAADE